MSEHKIDINWKNSRDNLSYYEYDRTHSWEFDGGKKMQASAAPEYVGDIQYVNPEEALAAALASCHMMSFLFVCSKKKFVVDTYVDKAVAILEKNSKNKMAVTKIYLNPIITFKGDKLPTKDEVKLLHEKAHDECFIANSVLTEVIINY